MSLDDFFEQDPQPQVDQDIVDLIKRRRLQLIVHSCIYYRLNDNIISDATYDKWTLELVDLLEKYPGAYSDQYDEYFENWKGETGFHFPHGDPDVLSKAQYLIRLHENNS